MPITKNKPIDIELVDIPNEPPEQREKREKALEVEIRDDNLAHEAGRAAWASAKIKEGKGNIPSPDTREAERANPNSPIFVENVEDAIEHGNNPESRKGGTPFFFGELGVIEFEDGTNYHVTKQNDTVKDAATVANLTKFAEKNPSYKIFKNGEAPKPKTAKAKDDEDDEKEAKEREHAKAKADQEAKDKEHAKK